MSSTPLAFGVRTALVRLFPSSSSPPDSRADVSFRADWLLVDLACQAYNKVTVALYDTLGAESVGAYSALTRFSRYSYFLTRIRVSILAAHTVGALTPVHLASTTPTFQLSLLPQSTFPSF